MVAIAAAQSLRPARALANPRALPFTYPTDSLPKNGLEVEQYVDLSPLKYKSDSAVGDVWTMKFTLTTEFEYGITNKLELGLYIQADNNPGDNCGCSPFQFDGIKQRLRYRFAAPGQWPIDMAVYLELAELSNEFEIEAKLNFQRRFGPVAILVNLWAEREFYYNSPGEWAINPTGGVTWQVQSHFHIGIEYWMRAEYGAASKDPATIFNAAPHHFLGPALMVQFSRIWWSVGAYTRLDGLRDQMIDGEIYGHFFARTIIGLDF